MGFLQRLFGRENAQPAATEPATEPDPELFARTLERAAYYRFTPRRTPVPQDVSQYGYGWESFVQDPLPQLLQLEDFDGYLFDKVFDWDAEFVEDDDSYPTRLEELARAAGTWDQVSDVFCELDNDAGTGIFRYRVGGWHREAEFDLDGDWADPDLAMDMQIDVCPDDHVIVWHEDTVIFWLPTDLADEFEQEITSAPLGQRDL